MHSHNLVHTFLRTFVQFLYAGGAYLFLLLQECVHINEFASSSTARHRYRSTRGLSYARMNTRIVEGDVCVRCLHCGHWVNIAYPSREYESMVVVDVWRWDGVEPSVTVVSSIHAVRSCLRGNLVTEGEGGGGGGVGAVTSWETGRDCLPSNFTPK